MRSQVGLAARQRTAAHLVSSGPPTSNAASAWVRWSAAPAFGWLAVRRASESRRGWSAEAEALAEQLNDAVTELTSTQAWLGMLRVTARFTRYSPTNGLLL